MSHLVGLEGEYGWERVMKECGLTIALIEDCSTDLLNHFPRLQ